MFSLRDVPGKGKGLVANEDIPRGTRILEETPIITIPDEAQHDDVLKNQIVKQMNSLTEQQRQSMLSMHNIYPYSNITEQCLGIIRTNALPIDANGIGGGLFLEACRINHSCDNNAQKSWNQRIKRHTVHALRDIPKGEEITIYYLNGESARAVRQKRLQDKFGFLCSCKLCSLSEEESQKSDKRLARIDQLDDLIGHDGMSMNFSSRTLRYAQERVRLYEEQRPGDSGLSRTYMDAAQVAIAKGDLARGRIFADRALDGWRASGGNDSQNVLEHEDLPKHPDKLQLYGHSMEWKTSVDEIPQGLDQRDFEDWLWRRETKANQELMQCSTGFRDQAIFPSYAGLPNKGSFFGVYEDSTNTDQPLKHWCFLGEITDVSSLLHLELELEDLDHKKLPLHFYTEQKGREVNVAQLRVGNTVAVLYAQRYSFVHGNPGIRHENSAMLKIFPTPLKTLLELNDRVQKFAEKIEGNRTCHGCNKKAKNLTKCGKCSMFWYCGKDCQKIGWNEKGHKADCKILKDADLRGLFGSKWTESDTRVSFPLINVVPESPRTSPGDQPQSGLAQGQRVLKEARPLPSRTLYPLYKSDCDNSWRDKVS